MPRQDSLAQGGYILSRTLATATRAASDDSPEPRIQWQARATHMAYNRHPNSALLSMVSFSVAGAGVQERLLRVLRGATNSWLTGQEQQISSSRRCPHSPGPLRWITRAVLISS
jgi:hypothetical protein